MTDDRVIDLAAWLREQLDADADLARRAQDNPWLGALIGARQAGKATYREFVGTWTPDRVLAECDARRRVLAVHNTWDRVYPDSADGDMRCVGCGFDGMEELVTEHVDDCPVLRALALPLADRPGYREEWRP